MNRFGLGHCCRQRFVDTTQFGFLGRELRFDILYLAVEFVLLVKQVAFVAFRLALLIAHLRQLFVGQFGQEHALEMEHRRVIELDHTRTDTDGLRTVVIGAVKQFDDGFFELTDLAVIGFAETVGSKEPHVIAVLRFAARHLVVHAVKDVCYVVYFDLVICHLDPQATLELELSINKGRGYVPADENREFCKEINDIAIDSIYTPIRNVKFAVENYRVAQKTDYEKLVLEITTDGSIHPKDALREASKILIYHLMLFSDEKITLENADFDGNEEFDEEVLRMRQLLKTKLVDMNLSVRALNCLKAADVETLGDLVQFNKTDLLKFRNFGKKSLTELDDLLESLNLSFGTDISKYKLDKD